MPILDLYQHYGIDTAPEGHKHHRPGWLNIECPHCSGSFGYHLGFNIEDAYFYCFRCGSHSIQETLMKLLNVRFQQADAIAKSYKLFRKGYSQDTQATLKHIKIKKKGFKLPSGIIPLQKSHRRYLESRGFNSYELENDWGLVATDPTSSLDGIPYKYRILAPIQWEGQTVSFQARDWTGKQELKYRACPEERERIHHKHILYGHPSLWEKRRAFLVEGIFDVWRLRLSACCTFGTGYTNEQAKLMVKMFDELFILFDPELIAQKRAMELQQELSFWGVNAHLLTDRETGLLTDPGDMTQEEADHLLRQYDML